MCGKDLVGYGRYHYKYATGREGESSIVGLSSRKAYISVHATGGDGELYVAERFKDQMPQADNRQVLHPVQEVRAHRLRRAGQDPEGVGGDHGADEGACGGVAGRPQNVSTLL